MLEKELKKIKYELRFRGVYKTPPLKVLKKGKTPPIQVLRGEIWVFYGCFSGVRFKAVSI